MDNKDLMKAIGEVDGDLVDSARIAGRKKHTAQKIVAAAACVAIICSGAYVALRPRDSGIELRQSSGVSVGKPVVTPKPEFSSADLIYLTEDELINGWTKDIKTDIFYATVTSIDYITVDFNGRGENWSLVTLRIGKVLRGDCREGDETVMQVHLPIGGDVFAEDSDVVSRLEIGSSGIFMPTEYADDSVYITNGATLYLAEISPYGLADGERFIFLDDENGAVYAEFAYPSLGETASLPQIEQFITEKLR